MVQILGSHIAAITDVFHATNIKACMILHWKRNRQCADRAEVPLRPLVSLTVQLLLLELCRTLLE